MFLKWLLYGNGLIGNSRLAQRPRYHVEVTRLRLRFGLRLRLDYDYDWITITIGIAQNDVQMACLSYPQTLVFATL